MLSGHSKNPYRRLSGSSKGFWDARNMII
jgi:hypothetical protein